MCGYSYAFLGSHVWMEIKAGRPPGCCRAWRDIDLVGAAHLPQFRADPETPRPLKLKVWIDEKRSQSATSGLKASADSNNGVDIRLINGGFGLQP